MDRAALKIRNVMSAEILRLEGQFDDLFNETGNKGEAMCDDDGVLLSDKIKVLKQLIRTIDGMEKRGEI